MLCKVTDSENISIYYQNVGGLHSKLSEFFIAISQEEYSVMTLTGTWLYSQLSNAQLFNRNYQIYRKDNYTDSINREGGKFEDNSIEQICDCLQ